MAFEQNKCPIWGAPATLSTEDYGRIIHVDSSRAGGRYTITGLSTNTLANMELADKARLTTWIIDQRAAGVDDPKIDRDIVAYVKKRSPLPVTDRGERLLRHLRSRVPTIGDRINMLPAGEEPAMLAWSESCKMSEVTYLLDYLIESGFLEKFPPASLSALTEYAITPNGHAHLATRAIDSAQAFVAMWFDDSMNEAYDKGILPAIEDAGYRAFRIDRKDHNNKIDDEIIAEIRRSRFLVADFTQGDSGARGGVYYEAGFAHGLNMPVIFTCRRSGIDDVHFDTRQYNHIVWETPDELRDRLAKRISATIGDGPNKKAG